MNESKEQLETLLSDYVDGNLAGDQLAAVEKYLDANPGLRDSINRMMIDSEALRSLPRVTAPYDFSEDVRGQLERDLLLDDAMAAFPRRRRISSLLMTVAAMLLIVVGLASVSYWIIANRPAPFLDVASHTPVPQDEPSILARERADDLTSEKVETGDRRGAAERSAISLEKPSKTPAAAVPDAFSTMRATGRSIHAARVQAPEATPAEVKELIVESPRYNRRARAIVIESEDAAPAGQAIQLFMATNPVKTQTLAYDATRNRAVGPAPSQPLADAMSKTAPELQQISGGVMTNSSTSAAGQALEQSPIQSNLPEPQVVMAIGLTDAQADALQQSLELQLGEDRAPAFEVAQAATLDFGKEKSETDAMTVADDAEHARQKEEPNPTVPSSQPAALAVGDKLVVTLIDPDASNLKTVHEVTIDANGEIRLPQLESIPAAEMTIASLRQTIIDAYVSKDLMKRPVVDIEAPGRFAVTSAVDEKGYGAKDLKVGAVAAPKQSVPDGLVTNLPAEMPQGDLIDVFVVVRGKDALNLSRDLNTIPAIVTPTTTTTQPAAQPE